MKKLIPIILILSLFLSACGSSAPAAATSAPPTEAEEVSDAGYRWTSDEQLVLPHSAFSEPTRPDMNGWLTFRVPQSWKKNIYNSDYTYYYPADDSSDSFFMVENEELTGPMTTADAGIYDRQWTNIINVFMSGMAESDEFSDIYATRYVVNGYKIAIIESDYHFERQGIQVNGKIYDAVFIHLNSVKIIGVMLADNDEIMTLDDFYAIVYSVILLEDKTTKPA